MTYNYKCFAIRQIFINDVSRFVPFYYFSNLSNVPCFSWQLEYKICRVLDCQHQHDLIRLTITAEF